MRLALLWIALGSLALLGCRRAPAPPQDHEPASQPTNRIAVPEAVRKNLGIRFVKVERRRVAATLRVPGHFELLPAAKREYRTPLAGRVEILVQPLQAVKQGDPLYRIDAPEWRGKQKEIGELTTAIVVQEKRQKALAPLLNAHHQHEQSLAQAILVLEKRIENLEATRVSVGGQGQELAQAQLQLAQLRADLTDTGEKHAETEATLAELEANSLAAVDRLALALESAAALLGTTRELLAAPVASRPAWRALAAIEVRASAAGVVDLLPIAPGGWVETGGLVVSTVDVQRVRFRARGLQSDLGRLRSGLPAAVVAALGGIAIEERVLGVLKLGVDADPEQRTLDLFLVPESVPEWARSGVAAFLEIETRSGGPQELAIPRSCVLQDGLQKVLFRRDPGDPDQVIRLEADLGVDDGRWVEVKSGVKDGDEVVLQGAYELMLASSGSATKGGHFHADGTFHSAEDKK